LTWKYCEPAKRLHPPDSVIIDISGAKVSGIIGVCAAVIANKNTIDSFCVFDFCDKPNSVFAFHVLPRFFVILLFPFFFSFDVFSHSSFSFFVSVFD
jgi:hypothetical protein